MYRFKEIYFENREKQIYHSPPIAENIFDLVHRSDIKAVKAKIHKGTSVDIRNEKGQTLLHYAILYNQVKIAEFLISLGANLDAIDNNGQKVRYIIQESYPDLYDKLDEYTSGSTSILAEEQGLTESAQVKELGQSDDCCCII